MEKIPQKQDRRIKKTENAIHEAFQSLLAEKKYSEITVKELTERADITRKTFYLHYGTLDDVLYEFLSDRIENIWPGNLASATNTQEGFLVDLSEDEYIKLFTYLRQNLKRENNIRINKLMEDETTRHFMYQILMEKQKEMWEVYQKRYGINPEVAKLYATFISYGFNAVFMRWYTSPDSLTVEELAKMMGDIAACLHGLPEKWEEIA